MTSMDRTDNSDDCLTLSGHALNTVNKYLNMTGPIEMYSIRVTLPLTRFRENALQSKRRHSNGHQKCDTFEFIQIINCFIFLIRHVTRIKLLVNIKLYKTFRNIINIWRRHRGFARINEMNSSAIAHLSYVVTKVEADQK